MNYEFFGLIGLVIAYFIREWTVKRQQKNLTNELAKAKRALNKEKNRNAAKQSKKSGKNYYDLRDAYGRFSRKGKRSGRA